MPQRTVPGLFLLAFSLAAALPGAAQTPPPAPSSAPNQATTQATTLRSDAYTEFALGKFAELQAESHGGGAYIDQAMAHYTAAMKDDPSSAYIATQMADLLSRVGRAADAITLAQTVIQQHPDSVEAHSTLGQIYLRQLSDVTQDRTKMPMAQAVAEYQTLVRLEPGNADHHVILGKLYGAQGDAAQAEKEFRTALTLDPTSDDAVTSLVQSLADQGKMDQAAQEIASLPAPARTGRVYDALGSAYEQRHQYKAAADAYRQAAQLEPDDPDFQHQLAQSLMDAGNFPDALAEFQRLATQTPDDGRVALRIAQIQQQMGALPDADQSLAKAAAMLPANDLELGYTRALLSESEGHNDQAIVQLQALIQQTSSPGNRGLFLDQLGSAQLRAGDGPGALATYQKMEALGPAYQSRAVAHEIDAYTQQRDYAKAIATAEASLGQHPGDRSLQLVYAHLLAQTGKTDAALAQLQPLMAGNAGDWDLYLERAEIHEDARQWTAAAADAARAGQLAAADADKAQAAAQLGDIQQKQKQFDAAEASYRSALQLDPGNPNVLNALSFALAEHGVRLPEALDDIQLALQRDGNNGAYLDTLGWVEFKLNRNADAVASLERAASLDANDPDVLDHLAQAYDRAGQLQQAATSWQRALADWKLQPTADYDAQQVAQIEKRLADLQVRIKQRF